MSSSSASHICAARNWIHLIFILWGTWNPSFIRYPLRTLKCFANLYNKITNKTEWFLKPFNVSNSPWLRVHWSVRWPFWAFPLNVKRIVVETYKGVTQKQSDYAHMWVYKTFLHFFSGSEPLLKVGPTCYWI